MSGRTLTFCGLTAVHPQDRSQYHSLCFAYLAAYAQKHASWTKVTVTPDDKAAIAQRPDLVGISASSLNIKIAVRWAERIKRELNVPVVLGGIHITALPHTLPAPFDIGVIGEGELTFIELLRFFRETRNPDAAQLQAVDGLVFRDGDRVVQTAPREPIADLGELPPPDRTILGDRFSSAHMVTSRGCPFDCRFCSSKRFWGSWRAFPVETVLAEIDDLVGNFGVEEIHFFDDLFAVDQKRLTAIADGLIKRGYPGRIKFSCTLRAESADEATFTQLARMGVQRVTFGAESNSLRVLRWLKGPGASVEANQRTLDLAKEHGMICSPSFIKGTPGETGDDLLATYEFILRGIRERKIDYFEVHCLTPFPGTAIWDLAKERGLVDETMDFDELRVPWERLYMNEAMPKTSFYFFENLTEIGMRWLGMSKRKVIGIVDVSHGVEHLPVLADDLRARGILDDWHAVVFHGDVDAAELKAQGFDAGGPELLQRYLDDDDPSLLFAYMRPEEGVDAEAVNRLIWWHYDHPVDMTLHSAFRHFAPATPFERSLAVGNQHGLRAGLDAFGSEKPLERLRRAGIAVATYRPDDDPWAIRSQTAALFSDKLKRDFGIERPWKGREKLFAAVEERIVTDAAVLPKREARARKIGKMTDALREAMRRLRDREQRG